MAPGNDEDMARRDGAQVPEGESLVIHRDALGGDVSADDPTEDALGHAEANLLRDDATARFLWDARNSEAARARAREHWIRQQAREAATFEGILRALSERGRPVTAWTSDGARATGKVVTISEELVLIESAEAEQTWLVRRSLAGVSGPSEGTDAGVASDDRGPTSTTTLAGLLADMAEARSALTLRSAGADVSGRLVGAGTDVVTVRLADGGLTYLPVAAVTLLRLA